MFKENVMLSADDPAQRIFNCDETDCSIDPNKKLFFTKSEKDSYLLIPNSDKVMYTVLLVWLEAEQFLPLCISYKEKGIYGIWITGGPAGCTYANSHGGWISIDVLDEEKLYPTCVWSPQTYFPILWWSWFTPHICHSQSCKWTIKF